MSLKERKRELKRMRDRQYQKRKRDLKNRAKGKTAIGKSRAQFTAPMRSNARRLRDYDSDSDDEEPRSRRTKGRGSRSNKRTKRGGPSTRSLKGPISLALLDWQRRQMWNSGKKQKTL